VLLNGRGGRRGIASSIPRSGIQPFEEAIACLRTDATRTRAAIVAFALAMSILVCLTALVERGRAATVRTLEKAGLRNIYLVNRVVPGRGLEPGLTAADVERLGEVLGFRRAAVIRIGRAAGMGSEEGAPIYAVAGSYASIFDLHARSGRLLTALDVDRKSSACLIGSALPPAGFSGGGIVRVGPRSYEIVGRMAECESENVSVAEIPSLDWNRAVVVSLGAEPGAPLVPDARYPADVAVLSFDTVSEADAAVGRIVALDPQRYRGGPVRVASPVQTLRQYRQTRQTFDRLIWLVAFLTAASAVVGISNILSASVIARTREIGLRRAVGARSIDIIRQFQAEGVLLGAIGGGVGLLAGLVLSLLLTRSSGSGAALSGATLCGLAAACLVIGVLTGLRPSRRAAQIDPAAALREG
jgi:putative ABC transport system permease protein